LIFKKKSKLKTSSLLNFAVSDGRTTLVSRIVVDTNDVAATNNSSSCNTVNSSTTTTTTTTSNNENNENNENNKNNNNDNDKSKENKPKEPTYNNNNQQLAQPASLYFSAGSNFVKCSDGKYRMRHSNMNEDVVIVASERLSEVREDWVEVPVNHILLISHKTNILLFPVNVEKELKKLIKIKKIKKKNKIYK